MFVPKQSLVVRSTGINDTYHVKDVRAHSSAEFGMLPIGCADQLIADSCF